MKVVFRAIILAALIVHQTASAALIITEVMSTSNAPAAGSLSGLDWWELTNTGPAAVSLNNFAWEDDNPMGTDTAIFPNGINIAVNESIIVHQGIGATVAADFRTAWNLPASVQVLTQAQFTGANPFSGLGSGGDQVNLYNNLAAIVDNATFGASTAGVSFEWGRNNSDLGLSVAGQNGAYQITYAASTVTAIGSPGRSAVPEPSTVLMLGLAIAGLSHYQRRRG